MWFEPSEVCAATVMPTEPSTRDSSSIGGYVLDVAHARAAVFDGKDGPQQAQSAQFLHRFQGKFAGFVPLHDIGRNFALGELAHHLLQLQLLIRELEIHGPLHRRVPATPLKSPQRVVETSDYPTLTETQRVPKWSNDSVGGY